MDVGREGFLEIVGKWAAQVDVNACCGPCGGGGEAADRPPEGARAAAMRSRRRKLQLQLQPVLLRTKLPGIITISYSSRLPSFPTFLLPPAAALAL